MRAGSVSLEESAPFADEADTLLKYICISLSASEACASLSESARGSLARSSFSASGFERRASLLVFGPSLELLRLALTESSKILPYVLGSRKVVKIYLKVRHPVAM